MRLKWCIALSSHFDCAIIRIQWIASLLKAYHAISVSRMQSDKQLCHMNNDGIDSLWLQFADYMPVNWWVNTSSSMRCCFLLFCLVLFNVCWCNQPILYVCAHFQYIARFLHAYIIIVDEIIQFQIYRFVKCAFHQLGCVYDRNWSVLFCGNSPTRPFI